MLNSTNNKFYAKPQCILTKKRQQTYLSPFFERLYKIESFFVLNGKFLNKLVLNITGNKFVCRRRHDERSTTTG